MQVNIDSLQADLKRAMLARDPRRVRVLRGVLAALKNRAIEKKGAALTGDDVLAVLKRERKQREESLDYARKADRVETVEELQAELAILEEYLPTPLSRDELRAAIQTIIEETGASAIGPIMKELNARFPGRIDGRLASALAHEALPR